VKNSNRKTVIRVPRIPCNSTIQWFHLSCGFIFLPPVYYLWWLSIL